jgi:hypothetical protein
MGRHKGRPRITSQYSGGAFQTVKLRLFAEKEEPALPLMIDLIRFEMGHC